MHRLADWVTRAPKQVLTVWAVLLALAAPLAWQAPGRLSASIGELPNAESTRVTELLRGEFAEQALNPVLLVFKPGPQADPQATEQAAADYRAGLLELPGVSAVRSSQEVGLSRAATSQGAELVVAQIPLYGGADQTLAAIREYSARFEQQRGVDIGVTGGQAIAADFTHYAEADTKRSELTALPLIAGVLLLVFGALVASGLPILVGVVSITASMALLYLLTGVMEVATFAQSVVTMLGLGAGIDYALLMVSRFREELGRGQSSAGAAHTALLTAGRSVMWSGTTVMIAMAGLLVPPIAFVQSIGVGGVLTVLMTVLASVTVLPALLTLLGERVNSPRRWALRPGRLAEPSPGWQRWAWSVMRRPWHWTLLGAGFLLLLAWPLGAVQTGYGGAWGLSPGIESRDALEDVRGLGAGGLLSQFEVVLPLARPYDPARDAEAFRQTVERVQAVGGVQAVISPFLSAADLQAAGAQGSGLDGLGAAIELNRRSFSQSGDFLRFTVIPNHYLNAAEIDRLDPQLRAALEAGPAPGLSGRPLLGGAPVGEREFSRAVTGALPGVMLSVFAATFVLLLLAFRSLVVPVKSILLNGLTVAAAAGVVAAVQTGPLGALLGFPPGSGVMDAMLPLLLFTVMFGLSMDYEIFLISRVHEGVQGGLENDEAVAQALGRTARIITSAALIMFIVFAAFIAGRVVLTKSIGLGLATAVLLDATLVRLALVPAVLRLAGDWNWWLPAPLRRWLPQVDLQH
ncbi:MMPL domain protein (plasmid) [Deinococcus proteolyticus MRP]|uniref:MMPL domain protein n=1 Tax=Deinococcus proteolyticus (strain ATCC 35074 / DSM 20540 / JCM 6276 / NBRC 101906 / NCIMB 13154 / VKM Ac-1939 / CCM 2703 / MRP) TaxID=693977 RepID=F0RPT0_DEIPM|nr:MULTISPECIES: MMPL family transporter [Deinococcus]ADY27386.1 MMPL domain protein [Deinococcus proteolyticus MRP]MCY1704261.1 MMPL family transporter [Deinococcus sp. SL84]